VTRPLVRAVTWILFCLALVPVAMAAGKEAKKDAKDNGEAKEVSGMSIMGNNETPKSLYIVPWKSSEIGGNTNLTSSLLNDSMTAVDREVFMRELDFYDLSKAN
jgi:hypothetical protein